MSLFLRATTPHFETTPNSLQATGGRWMDRPPFGRAQSWGPEHLGVLLGSPLKPPLKENQLSTPPVIEFPRALSVFSRTIPNPALRALPNPNRPRQRKTQETWTFNKPLGKLSFSLWLSTFSREHLSKFTTPFCPSIWASDP